MKFAAVLLASTAAVASAATCDVSILSGLVAKAEFTGCEDDSGYTLTSLTVPDDATVAKMCTSTSCKTLLNDLIELNPGDCTLGTLAIMSDLVDPIVATCGWSTGSSSGSSATTATVGSTSSGSSDASIVATSSDASTASSTAASTASSTASSASSTGSASASASAGSSSASSIATGVAATAFAVAAAAML